MRIKVKILQEVVFGKNDRGCILLVDPPLTVTSSIPNRELGYITVTGSELYVHEEDYEYLDKFSSEQDLEKMTFKLDLTHLKLDVSQPRTVNMEYSEPHVIEPHIWLSKHTFHEKQQQYSL